MFLAGPIFALALKILPRPGPSRAQFAYGKKPDSPLCSRPFRAKFREGPRDSLGWARPAPLNYRLARPHRLAGCPLDRAPMVARSKNALNINRFAQTIEEKRLNPKTHFTPKYL